MGAQLRYAKVIDLAAYQRRGKEIHPALPSGVELSTEDPAVVKPFLVLRAWDDFDSMTESWRIRDPHGRTVYGPAVREVLAEDNELADEVVDLRVDHLAEDYQLVLDVDGGEVARADFPIHAPGTFEPAG
jgi:hypothetical protein